MRSARAILPKWQSFRIPSERCRSYAARWNPSTSFSTSARACAVGPESPNFIHVPQPVQPRYPSKPIIKGVLPVPREVFRTRFSRKISPGYIASVTKEPLSGDVSTSAAPGSALAERLAWRRRLAASRRRLLREGLVELHERKARTEKAAAARSALRFAEREQAVNRPQREDERLTSPTIIQAMKQLQTGILPDEDREARVAAKAARVKALQEKIREKRKDLLQTLYANARLFITTEGHLNHEIRRAFAECPKEWDHDTGKGVSIWNVGPPVSVAELIEGPRTRDPKALTHHEAGPLKNQERVMRIAEALMGGKIL